MIKDSSSQQYYSANATTITGRKCLRIATPTRLASIACTVSVPFESTDIREPRPRASITAICQKYRIPGADQEMANIDSVDNSDDEDYRDIRDTVGSGIRNLRRPRNRASRAKNVEDTSMDIGLTRAHIAGITTAANPSGNIQKSEQIPVQGYLILKIVKSELVYYLLFTQEPLPYTQNLDQKRDNSAGFENCFLISPVTNADHIWEICKIVDRKIISSEKFYKIR